MTTRTKNDLKNRTFKILAIFGTPGLFSFLFLDQNIALYFTQPQFESFRSFCSKVTDLGVGTAYFALSALAYCLGRWLVPYIKGLRQYAEPVRWIGGFTFSSLFLIGLCVQILKGIFGRQRPHMTASFYPFEFDPINFHWHWHSFPSGHSQVAFVLAAVLSILLPKFRKLFFALGAFIAFTRVVTHQHFLSDVFIGSAIGYIGTLWVYELFFKKTHFKFLHGQ